MVFLKMVCYVFDEKDWNDILDFKSLVGSFMIRNVVDLFLVVIIFVLFNVVVLIICGDYCGKFNIGYCCMWCFVILNWGLYID